jgi:hypothetical protein
MRREKDLKKRISLLPLLASRTDTTPYKEVHLPDVFRPAALE